MSSSKKSTTLAFSETSFDSDSYAKFRPTYGEPLFTQLDRYHGARLRDLAVDIGCGTGQITGTLAESFGRVVGVDTSGKMLEGALRRENIRYVVSGAEAIAEETVEPGSVDLVTVGQAAHWFRHDAWFAEMARILKVDGTLSFWSYNEAVFTNHSGATEIWNRYSHDEDKLGPHWPQPGRRILESAMDGVDPPPALFKDIERHYTAQRGSEDPSPVSKRMPLDAAEFYFRTSSAFHNWQTKYPEARPRREGSQARSGSSSGSSSSRGDVMDEMMDEIKKVTGWVGTTPVNIHWPTVAVLARKR